MSSRRQTSLLQGSGTRVSLDNEDIVNARKRLRATSPGGTVILEPSALLSELEDVRNRLRPASPASMVWERETSSGHTLIWHPQENYIGPAMGLPPVAPRSRNASPIRVLTSSRPVSRGVSPARPVTQSLSVSRPISRGVSPSRLDVRSRAVSPTDDWPAVRKLSPSRLDNRPVTRGSNLIRPKTRGSLINYDEVPIHPTLSTSRLDNRRNISPSRSLDNRLSSSSRSSSPSILNDSKIRGMSRPSVSRGAKATVIENIDSRVGVTQSSIVGRSTVSTRGVSQPETFLSLSRASNASQCAISSSFTGDYGPIARPKSRGLSPSSGYTVYMKSSSRGPSPVRDYGDYEHFVGSRGPSPSRTNEFGAPGRPLTSRARSRDASPVYIHSRGPSPSPRASRSRGPSPAPQAGRSRNASPARGLSPGRPRGRPVNRAGKSAVTPIDPYPHPATRGGNSAVTPIDEPFSRPLTRSGMKVISPVMEPPLAFSRPVTRSGKSAVTKVPDIPPPCTPATMPIVIPGPELPSQHSMRIAPPVIRSRPRGSTAFVVWNEASNMPPPRTPRSESSDNKKGMKSMSSSNGTSSTATKGGKGDSAASGAPLPDGVTSPDAPLPSGPDHIGQGVWQNSAPVPGAKQKSRENTTLDENAEVNFDAASAQRHLEGDKNEQASAAGAWAARGTGSKIESTVAAMKSLSTMSTAKQQFFSSKGNAEGTATAEDKAGGSQAAGDGGDKAGDQVKATQDETNKGEAKQKEEVQVEATKEEKVVETDTESQSAASGVVSKPASASSKTSSVRERASQGLGSAASRVKMLASSSSPFSSTKSLKQLSDVSETIEEATPEMIAAAAVAAETEKIASLQLAKTQKALEDTKALQEKQSEASARLLDMMASQRRTHDVTEKIKKLISEEGITPVATAKLQGMLVSHQRTAEAAKKLKDFMVDEGLAGNDIAMKLEDIIECQMKTTEANDKLESIMEHMTLQEADEILATVVDTQERTTDKATQLQEMVDVKTEGIKKKITTLTEAVEVRQTKLKEARGELEAIGTFTMPTVTEEAEHTLESAPEKIVQPTTDINANSEIVKVAGKGGKKSLDATNNAVLQISRLKNRRQSIQASAAAAQILAAAETPGIPLEMQETADKAVSEAMHIKSDTKPTKPEVVAAAGVVNTKAQGEQTVVAPAITTVKEKVATEVKKEAEKQMTTVTEASKNVQKKIEGSAPVRAAKTMEENIIIVEDPPGCCGGRSSLARKLAARKWPGCCARCIKVPAPKKPPEPPKSKNMGPGCCKRFFSKLMCCKCCKKKDPDVEAPVMPPSAAPKLSFCTRFRRALCCGALKACCGALSCKRCSPCCAKVSCACCCPCFAKSPCCRKCCHRGAVGDINPNPLDDPGRRKSQDSRLKSKRPSRSMPGPEVPKLDQSLLDQNSVIQAAIPVLSLPLAWFCLVCNVLVPGLGTIASGAFCLCFGRPRFTVEDRPEGRLTTFCLDLVIGVGQLFTVIFCLVGWGWSIWWGAIMVRLARKHKRLQARAAEEAAKPPNLRRPSEIERDKK